MSGASTKFDFSSKVARQDFSGLALGGLLGGAPALAQNAVVELDLDTLTPYPNQPFKPYPEERLLELTADIAHNGILSPIIVRPWGQGGHQILAGHNRCAAARKAGLESVPAIVKDVDDDTAVLIMTTTNLNQRDKLLPSEKAFAYKVQLEAMKRQGLRTDLTSGQAGQKWSRDKISETVSDSSRQIQRFVRLTFLLQSLLELVDREEIGMNPAVELSYLSHKEQQLVLDASAQCQRKISFLQAQQLKKAAQDGDLTAHQVEDILTPEKPWNPRGEFVSASRAHIPATATKADIEAVSQLVKQYFEKEGR